MQNQFTQMRNALSVLVGVLFVLSLFAARSAQADNTFTNASLKGTYAYVNNTENIASLGLIIFDGEGGVTATIKVNLPCSSPASGCPRNIVPATANSGTYKVNSDGTGIATIEFNTGTITYDFVISKTTEKEGILLATRVFAAGQTGGLAGQLTAPTWILRSAEDGTSVARD